MEQLKGTGRLKLSFLVIGFLLFCSCSSFLPSRSLQILRESGWPEEYSSCTYLAGEIEVSAALYEKQIMRSGRRSLKLLLNGLNEKGTVEKSGYALVLLTLEERGFIRDFRKVNTQSLLLEVKDELGTSLGSYYYCTESDNTFVSSSYLFNQLEKGINRLFR